MNRLLTVAFLLIGLSACGNSPETTQPAATPAAADPSGAKWVATEGMESPESVYADTASGSIFVSQVTGMPNEKDGTGRIVKLDMDGKVVNAKWVTGLNAPKGLRSHDGTLWTADIDEVVGIEITSGKITSRVKIEGAQFLNDVAAAPDGTIYVSDMMASRIYAVKDGKPSLFAEGENLEYPNGLLVDGGRLIVGGWGKPEADFTTKVPGRLYALDLKTKEKTPITPNPVGNIDGVESDGSGGYVITDWLAGKVMHITPTGDVHPLKTYMQGTADHAYLPSQGLLILPHMNENKVAAYSLAR
jgi:sugar lactone lactonase YvrE